MLAVEISGIVQTCCLHEVIVVLFGISCYKIVYILSITIEDVGKIQPVIDIKQIF